MGSSAGHFRRRLHYFLKRIDTISWSVPILPYGGISPFASDMNRSGCLVATWFRTQNRWRPNTRPSEHSIKKGPFSWNEPNVLYRHWHPVQHPASQGCRAFRYQPQEVLCRRWQSLTLWPCHCPSKTSTRMGRAEEGQPHLRRACISHGWETSLQIDRNGVFEDQHCFARIYSRKTKTASDMVCWPREAVERHTPCFIECAPHNETSEGPVLPLILQYGEWLTQHWSEFVARVIEGRRMARAHHQVTEVVSGNALAEGRSTWQCYRSTAERISPAYLTNGLADCRWRSRREDDIIDQLLPEGNI